jgi:hypothetical protein
VQLVRVREETPVAALHDRSQLLEPASGFLPALAALLRGERKFRNDSMGNGAKLLFKLFGKARFRSIRCGCRSLRRDGPRPFAV